MRKKSLLKRFLTYPTIENREKRIIQKYQTELNYLNQYSDDKLELLKINYYKTFLRKKDALSWIIVVIAIAVITTIFNQTKNLIKLVPVHNQANMILIVISLIVFCCILGLLALYLIYRFNIVYYAWERYKLIEYILNNRKK